MNPDVVVADVEVIRSASHIVLLIVTAAKKADLPDIRAASLP
jgi:hypothetical protein